MDIAFSDFAIAFMASALTEILKFFPVLNSQPIFKSLTAVLVVAAGAFYMSGFNIAAWDWNQFFTILMFSFVNYKMLIQPSAKAMSIRTQ